jgi:hypothetical protein
MVYDLRSKDDETAYGPSSVRAVPEHELLFGFAAQLGVLDPRCIKPRFSACSRAPVQAARVDAAGRRKPMTLDRV